MKYQISNVNKYIREGRYEELIEISESRRLVQVEQLYYLIRAADQDSKNLTDAVMITGPSSSGKTTFSNLIAQRLSEDGYHCTVVSIDDYYLNKEEIHRRQAEATGNKGLSESEYDYETIEAFDVPFFRRQMTEYAAGLPVTLPKFDFGSGKRVMGDVRLVPTEKDMIIVEGIHALNPVLCDGLGFHRAFKVYICPFDTYLFDGTDKVLLPQQIRFMRRAVRDRIKRNAPLKRTMSMWKSVRNGEEKYIKPVKKFADFFLNTSLEYEIAFLKKRIFEMKETLNASELEALEEILPLREMEQILGTEGFSIPEDSIFSEFYI